MNRLLEVGFEVSGHWLLDGGKLGLELTRHARQRNVIYAFVCDGQVKYIGKTNRTLSERMGNYRTPGATQSTNVNNHRRIKDLLEAGVAVEILVLRDSGLLHFGQFHLNLAAGLEDSLIRIVDPQWNGGKKELGEIATAAIAAAAPGGVDDVLVGVGPTSDEPSTIESKSTGGDPQADRRSPCNAKREADAPIAIVSRFTITLQPTYYSRGFFNVGVKAQQFIGHDGEVIELYLGAASTPVMGTINRRANQNGTPRIMVGQGLQNWFASNAVEMDEVLIEVMSPTSIRLRVDKLREGAPLTLP